MQKILPTMIFCSALALGACGEKTEPPTIPSPAAAPPAPKYDEANTLSAGDSRENVVAQLGEPDGSIMMGKAEILIYHGVQLTIQNGVLAQVPSNLQQQLRQGFDKKIERDRKKEALRIAGEAATAERSGQEGETSKAPIGRSQANPSPGTPIIKISNGGKTVDIKAYTGKGRTTIVDFYADWCGPCRQLTPVLEKLARKNPEIDLVKVDIKSWGTPITTQFKIRSIPYVRIYDEKGRFVSDKHSELKRLIERSK